MKIRESVTELIGNTPLLRLRKIEKQCGAKAALIAKGGTFQSRRQRKGSGRMEYDPGGGRRWSAENRWNDY